MKASIFTAFAAAVIAIPSFTFAQADTGGGTPMTRAQVKADLLRVEQAGYNPADSDIKYPADIQAAEARVNADRAYGGTSNNSANGSASQNQGN